MINNLYEKLFPSHLHHISNHNVYKNCTKELAKISIANNKMAFECVKSYFSCTQTLDTIPYIKIFMNNK